MQIGGLSALYIKSGLKLCYRTLLRWLYEENVFCHGAIFEVRNNTVQ